MFAKQSYYAYFRYKKGKILYTEDIHYMNYEYYKFKTEWLGKLAVRLELKKHDYHLENRDGYLLYVIENNYGYNYVIRQNEKVILLSLDEDCMQKGAI